jgi:hypothetical protein
MQDLFHCWADLPACKLRAALLLISQLAKFVRDCHDPGLHEASASNDGVTLWAFNGELRMPYARGSAGLAGHEADSLVRDFTHL